MTASTKELLRLHVGTGLDARALTSGESRAIALVPAMNVAPATGAGSTPIQSQRPGGNAMSRPDKDELPAGTWHQ
jgi:hypothetical protein